MDEADAVIVGAGHGGAQAAIALRQQGFTGSILMLGRDGDLPYERPPLSKDYLAKEKPFERILIRPASFWHEREVRLRGGCAVVRVDLSAHEVQLASGERIGYGKLIWATGGDPRRLSCPGSNLAGIHSIRDKSDVDTLIVNRRPIGTPYRRAKGTPLALRRLVDAGRVFRAAGGVGRA